MEGDDCSFKQDASLRTAVSERKPEVRGSKPGRCVPETGLVRPGKPPWRERSAGQGVSRQLGLGEDAASRSFDYVPCVKDTKRVNKTRTENGPVFSNKEINGER